MGKGRKRAYPVKVGPSYLEEKAVAGNSHWSLQAWRQQVEREGGELVRALPVAN
jgi:hypothetical protein